VKILVLVLNSEYLGFLLREFVALFYLSVWLFNRLYLLLLTCDSSRYCL